MGLRGDEAINLSPLTAPSDGIKEFGSLGKKREQPKFPIPLKGLEVGGVSKRERLFWERRETDGKWGQRKGARLGGKFFWRAPTAPASPPPPCSLLLSKKAG